jgi:hypothetical protein
MRFFRPIRSDSGHYGWAGIVVNPILEHHSREFEKTNKNSSLKLFPPRVCERLERENRAVVAKA